MRSMTGYGSGSMESPTHQLKLQIEITSVNRKTLDINLSAPKEWSGIEQKCAQWIKGNFERGRLQVQIKALPLASDKSGLGWNESMMEQTLDKLKGFADKHDLPLEADGRLLLELARSLKDESGLPDWRELTETIETAFNTALIDLNAMRAKEGAALQTDLSDRIVALESLRKDIAGHTQGATAQYRDSLLERLKQLDIELDISDERLLKEVAVFADRCDISEEITRLGSHFEQFNELLDSNESVGRKMDFLCQEIHREFNTIGSKANNIEITRAVIEGKNGLERIREQVQNIE